MENGKMKKVEFESQIQTHEIILKKYNGLSRVVGYTKLFLILLLGFIMYVTFFNEFRITLIILTGVTTVILIILWIYHSQVIEKVNDTKGIIAINKRHLTRISGDWTSFSDIGMEYINHNHPYSSDLDIVGQKSVFQFLNTTHTWHGRQAFVNALLGSTFSEEELEKRQAAISELSENISFSNTMEHNFSKIGVDATVNILINQLKNQEIFLKSKAIKSLLLHIPIISLLVNIVIFLRTQSYFAIVIVLFLQCLVWVIGILKTQNYLNNIFHLNYKLDEYGKIIAALKTRKFRSEKLNEIKEQLIDSETSATTAIKELDRILSKASVRSNPLVWVIMNALFLFDYQSAIRFEKWKLKYGVASERWFLALAEFESMMSFSHLANVCSTTCLPSIADGKVIEASKLGHPLIPNDKRVNNDVICNNHIFIVSGSNMSGKTTFMRAVGINLVLAQAGSFVCAKSMKFSQLEIMTSMRIADSLNEGLSTFYAELKRIKGIIELARKNSKMLFLIDEIFRGTNSVDRLSGAKTVLTKLEKLGVIGMITTHDLDLCDIASGHLRVKNYSFTETYRNNQIHFDYKVKSGKSTTTNAKYLMQMMDIM